jgi:hypothetical protein
VQLCDTFRAAERQIAEKSQYVNTFWEHVAVKLEYLNQIRNELNEEHTQLLLQNLSILDTKLITASSTLSRFVDHRPSRWGLKQFNKLKYVRMKEDLDTIIEDLRRWNEVFDPALFLTVRKRSTHIDRAISQTPGNTSSGSTTSESFPVKSLRLTVRGDSQTLTGESQLSAGIFRSQDRLRSAHIIDIRWSSAKVVHCRDGSNYILDSTICPPAVNSARMTEDVRSLAAKLRLANPSTFGLLTCRGVVKHADPADGKVSSFDFLFRPPEGPLQPQSLREALVVGDTRHSLSDRFRIAQQLATSIGYIHTFGFVHKNVRPETILLFPDAAALGPVYLLGFENFRSAEGKTYRSGDDNWERNLYRHPSRQGIHPEEDYMMQHDIYSLGVCLLEVGLWDTLVQYDGMGPQGSPSLLPTFVEGVEEWTPQNLKDHLVSLAREALPRRMGNIYAQVVETCLTCLDDDENSDFGDETEFHDDDGVLVGVRYIEKILSRLNSLAV